MVKRILQKIEGISREVDNDGWTPLHLAAYFNYVGFIVEQLLDKDREVAYMKDTKGRTPLHIAAQRGNYWAMKEIVERCPDCCELVDNRGWNVLHFLIKRGNYYMLDIIMDIIIENWSFSNLLNEKNADGDTPLHFYATTSSESLLALKKFVSHPRLDEMAFNKQHLNTWVISATEKRSLKELWNFEEALGYSFLPRRVITDEDNNTTKLEDKNMEKEKKKKKKEKRRSMLQKTTEVHLVVAALIATVTFAACITMPGGFVGGGEGEGSHPGSVLLRRKAAFKAFVITDTISMVLSSSAVFIHLLMPLLFNKDIDDDKGDPMRLAFLAFKFILWAMIAMGLAFVTGTYAVLMPSLDIAIANCIIGLTFFAILLGVIEKFNDLSYSDFFETLCPSKLDI
ncbi:protein ACCELERATED CELL DEATH 6-like [Corylus avellana]|uniref:protein ACCELERATED CELL DEATH 6-like n=1 Tax=Corylus avellana TaxID=13451 RepID=UPI00286BB61E|nr:protein ACCELERATED CELL DEATH 6-like [Corylus avellana]